MKSRFPESPKFTFSQHDVGAGGSAGSPSPRVCCFDLFLWGQTSVLISHLPLLKYSMTLSVIYALDFFSSKENSSAYKSRLLLLVYFLLKNFLTCEDSEMKLEAVLFLRVGNE